jgi:hypothetical protein
LSNNPEARKIGYVKYDDGDKLEMINLNQFRQEMARQGLRQIRVYAGTQDRLTLLSNPCACSVYFRIHHSRRIFSGLSAA